MTAAPIAAPFPTFEFNAHPWWTRLYCGLRYLPNAFRAIESREQLTPAFSVHLLNDDGQVLGISAGDVRYEGKPQDLGKLRAHILQLEDRRFFSHRGVDPRGIARALIANLRRLGVSQGGSTITQQLVRNTLLVPERSILRKVFEAVLALKLEKHYTKEEILNLYFNHVYLGKGIRGFPAAAKTIFRRNVSSLSENELCGLLGLLRRPTSTFPSGNASAFIARQKTVARILGRAGPPQRGEAQSLNPIDIASYRRPRFSQIVKSELARCDRGWVRDIRRVGLTIQSDIQHALSTELRAVVKLPDVEAAAGIIVSTKTADVLAESAFQKGGEAQSSYVYFGSVQAGSTFKTFALLSALQQGVSLDDLFDSAPFESTLYKAGRANPWRVRNYGNVYRGSLTLRDAFRHSDNTAFARLAELLDTNQLYKVYRSFGLCRDQILSPSIVLGGHKTGTSLFALVSAYRAIAAGGRFIRPRIVRYAELADGKLIWLPRDVEQVEMADFKSLRDLQLALWHSGPVVFGTKVSGKTGTTRTGSLFAGYNEDTAAAIWIGYGRVIAENDPKAVGAVSVFERLMNRVLGHRADLLSI